MGVLSLFVMLFLAAGSFQAAFWLGLQLQRRQDLEKNQTPSFHELNRAHAQLAMKGTPATSWAIFLLVIVMALLPRPSWPDPISVGTIDTDAAKGMKQFLPLATYLGKHLRSEGIDGGRVVVARGIPEMAAFLREGKVDLYLDSPYPSLAVSQLSGSELELRRWKKGLASYRSVIFVKSGSGVNRLEDLRGKMIAFEEPFSSTGYFFAKMALLESGLQLVAKTAPTERVAPPEVGYVFSSGDENTVVWVLRGLVAAGATDSQRFAKEVKRNPDMLTALHNTSPIPRQIVSVRAGLSPELVAKLNEILINMDQSEEGKTVLREFQQTTRFDKLAAPSHAQLSKARKFVEVEVGLERN